LNQILSESSLKVSDHSRDSAGLRYVYPVISRRAGGVSIGINLNPNNACNWRCIYCQVPDLKLGTAPPINLVLLEQELKNFLYELQHGNFMQRIPQESRHIKDIAISGNGEPTSAKEFVEVIEIIARIKPANLKLVLITNGSLIQRKQVQQGLRRIAQLNGEVWFKLDRASEIGIQQINNTHSSMDKVKLNLMTSIACCPNTWLQTCWFALDGKAPSRQDEDDYLDFLNLLLHENAFPKGILLYGLARPSMQSEAPLLSALSSNQLNDFASRISALCGEVQVGVLE